MQNKYVTSLKLVLYETNYVLGKRCTISFKKKIYALCVETRALIIIYNYTIITVDMLTCSRDYEIHQKGEK